jgi:hypothetical protein
MSSPARIRVSKATQRATLAVVVLATVSLALAGCGSSHPRTVVLRSALPATSDIWLRITGPGGAVSYVARRFKSGGAFSKFRFREAGRRGLFLPPGIRDQKLCASAHTISQGDAPQLQKWQGKTLEITVYGSEISAIYCAVLGPGLYLEGP